MISWIQRYFQHHFRAIFAVLLAVIIISFVFTIGAAPGLGRGDRRTVDREFFGYNLAMADDLQKLLGDASLSASLHLGAMGGVDREQLQQYAFERATLLHLADKWHIPEATPEEIKTDITKLRRFSSPMGEFDAKAYETFRAELKKGSTGATQADIARVIGQDVRMEKAQQLLAGPGYVLPGDIKSQLERTDTSWTIGLATANYASFKPEIKPTEADLLKFFEDNAFRYEIPPRVSASYIDFPAAQFAASVNVTEADIRAYYDTNPARFPALPTVEGAKIPSPSPEAAYAMVRGQVEAALRSERAQRLATKAASDFALSLYEAKTPNPQAAEQLAGNRKLQVKTLAPFTRAAGPAELGNSPEVATAAFRLNKDNFFSDAISSPSGAVILIWKDTLPAQKPQFAEVREKVSSDYIENEKRKRFVDLGKAAKAQIESRLRAGDNFEKAVAAASASGIALEAKNVNAFTLRNRPQDVEPTVLSALEGLQKGEVSDMTLSGDRGFIVYAADKKAPEMAETNPQYTEARNQMALFSSRMSSTSYVDELLQNEMKRSEPKQ